MNRNLIMDNLQQIFGNYFSGNNFSGALFNYNNLGSGNFFKFVNQTNFTYDSDYFNSSLSYFTQRYDIGGSFFITSNIPLENRIQIRNDFDPKLLNAQIEQQNEIVKYVPSFIFDVSGMWCIYFDNEADVFIVWCDDRIVDIFNKTFLIENNDFYYEKNGSLFLNTVAVRLTGQIDLQIEAFKKSIKLNNPLLFT